MDETMGLIYALLAGANYAVGEHRYERAQALAAIAQARAMADIATPCGMTRVTAWRTSCIT
jgi:DNA-binding phage protein